MPAALCFEIIYTPFPTGITPVLAHPATPAKQVEANTNASVFMELLPEKKLSDTLAKKLLINQVTETMQHQQMNFLDACGDFGRHADFHVQ